MLFSSQIVPIFGALIMATMGILFHFLNNMPDRSRATMPSENKLSLPKFGFAGLCLLMGLVTFAIQQGCAATGTAPSWMWGTVWFCLAIGLVVLAIWFWDQTASHHWLRKLVIASIVSAIMMFFSYIPIAKQYRAEHAKILPVVAPKVPSAEEIAEAVAKVVWHQATRHALRRVNLWSFLARPDGQ